MRLLLMVKALAHLYFGMVLGCRSDVHRITGAVIWRKGSGTYTWKVTR